MRTKTTYQFNLRGWRPFEILTARIDGRDCKCYLIGVDFKNGLLKLRSLDSNETTEVRIILNKH